MLGGSNILDAPISGAYDRYSSGGSQSGEVLRGVLGAIHPIDSRERRTAVIRIYGDLSGTSRNRFYVVACYVASEAQWSVADSRWKDALDRAGVDHFHATDFFSCHRAFRQWTKGSARHQEMEREFASVANAANLIGFANGVETAGYNDAFKTVLNKLKPRYRLRSLRLLCVQLCLQHIADVVEASNLPDDEGVAVVLEHEQGIGEVVDYFNKAKKQRAPWTKRIVSIGSGDKKKFRPLQIADLFAYLCFERFAQGKKTAMRPSLARMLQGDRHGVRVTTAKALREALPELQAFVEQYPSGVAWPKRERHP